MRQAINKPLFWLLMLVAGLAQAATHQHAPEPKPASVCDDPEAPASLRCALAPSAAFGADGVLWVAWAFGGHVYVSRSDDKGQSFLSPIVVNTIPERIAADGENRPKIAVTPGGNVYLSWTQRLDKRFTGHIRFSRSVDGGRHFSEPLTVNDNLEVISHRFEAMAVSGERDVFLAWLDKRDRERAEKEGGKYRGAAVYYARSDDGGKTFTANRKIADHSCECCRVAMTVDTDGLPVAVWRHVFGENTRDHALTKFVDRDRPGEVRRLSFDDWRVDACPHHGPAISIAGDGVFHATWFNNAPERHGLFYARSADGGQRFSAPVRVGNYEAGAAHAHVLSLGDEVFVTWKEFDGSRSALYVMTSVDGGTSWSAPRSLLTSQASSDHPFLVHDGRRVYASWHRRGEEYRLIPVRGAGGSDASD